MNRRAQKPLITTIRSRQVRMISTITALILEMGSVRIREGFSSTISQFARVVALLREYHFPCSLLPPSSVSARKEYSVCLGEITRSLQSSETLVKTRKKFSGSSVMLMQFSE